MSSLFTFPLRHSTQVNGKEKKKQIKKIPVRFLFFRDTNLRRVLPAVPSDHKHFISLKHGSGTLGWTFPAESCCLLRGALSSWIT